MSCEYCGRTNTHDGHGGCYSCGAPLTFDEVYSQDYYAASSSAAYVSTDLACTVVASVGTAIAYVSPALRSRRAHAPYKAAPSYRSDSDSGFDYIGGALGFGLATGMFDSSSPISGGSDFSGGGGDFGGGGASGDW